MPPRSPSRKRAMAGDPNQTGVEAMLRQIASKPASPELKREAAVTLLSSLITGGQLGSMAANAAGLGLPTALTVLTRLAAKRAFEKKVTTAVFKRERMLAKQRKVWAEAARRLEANRQALQDIQRLPQKERAKYDKLTELILKDIAKNRKRTNLNTREKQMDRTYEKFQREVVRAGNEQAARVKDIEETPQSMMKLQGSGTRLLFELEDDLSRRMVENAERSLKRLREPSPEPGGR